MPSADMIFQCRQGHQCSTNELAPDSLTNHNKTQSKLTILGMVKVSSPHRTFYIVVISGIS